MSGSQSHRGSRAWALGVVALLTVGGVSACASSRQATISPPTQSATPTPAQVVTRVGLVDTDLANGYKVRLMPGGDQVAGQVTLDYCGYSFTTEANRVARRQVTVATMDGKPVGLSNEVVAYDSAASAAKALAQFRSSLTHCPKNVYEPSTVAGVPDLRFDVRRLTSAPNLPVPDNSLVTLVVTPKGSARHVYGVLVFERHGAVLDGTYLQSATKPTNAEIGTVVALAIATGKRLAAS